MAADGGAAAPGREAQGTTREKEEGRPGSPRPEPSLPLPQRPVLGRAQNLGAGRACAMTRCANRQRSETAGTSWNRLEPVAPAGKPTSHKGRRRLTARVSLRRAGVGGCGGCAPPPAFVRRPGLGTRPPSSRGAGSRRAPGTKVGGAGTEPPRSGPSPVWPSLQLGWPCGSPPGKPSVPLSLPVPQASPGSRALCRLGRSYTP